MKEHAFMQEEKGPEDMCGVTVRVLKEWPTTADGYARFLVDFWASQKAYDSNEAGFDGLRKSDIEKRYILHPNAFYTIKAAKQERKQ